GEAEALVDFSLNVCPGEFLTVIGTSGSGKTTFLKMINGLIAPDSGRVEVEGEDIAQVDLIALRRRIGYTIQGVGLFPHMTVAQN
ncbi:MAG: ATP-binding cassette domain-containing protein, partial [Eubacterium sp.]